MIPTQDTWSSTRRQQKIGKMGNNPPAHIIKKKLQKKLNITLQKSRRGGCLHGVKILIFAPKNPEKL